MKAKDKNPSQWDIYLKKIVTQPIENQKDRKIVEAAREKIDEIRMDGFKLTTEI